MARSAKRKTQVMYFLSHALETGRIDLFKKVLGNQYIGKNVSEVLEKIDLPPRTFYDALSDNGNPSLRTIMKIIEGIE